MTATMAPQDREGQPCYLLNRIPVDIRLQIYQYYFGGVKNYWMVADWEKGVCYLNHIRHDPDSCELDEDDDGVYNCDTFPGSCSESDLALLRTCKMIYEEAGPIFPQHRRLLMKLDAGNDRLMNPRKGGLGNAWWSMKWQELRIMLDPDQMGWQSDSAEKERDAARWSRLFAFVNFECRAKSLKFLIHHDPD